MTEAKNLSLLVFRELEKRDPLLAARYVAELAALVAAAEEPGRNGTKNQKR